LLSLLILGSVWFNAEVWVDDYPTDIKKQFGPIGEKAKKQRMLFAIPFILLLLGAIAVLIFRLDRLSRGGLEFGSLFLGIFVLLSVFNLVDLLILDWLIFVTLRPRFVILPGTEGMKGYGDYGFHFRGFLIGLALSLIGSSLVAGVIWLVSRILS
jgi:hypothetical protein